MYRLLSMLLVACLVSPTFAQPRERFRLPEGTRTPEAHCYNLTEYRQLLQMDVDLEYYFNLHTNLAEQLSLRTQQVEEFQLQVRTLTTEVQRLRVSWQEENRLRHEAENAPSVSAFVGWTLAIIGVIAATSFGIAFAVSR